MIWGLLSCALPVYTESPLEVPRDKRPFSESCQAMTKNPVAFDRQLISIEMSAGCASVSSKLQEGATFWSSAVLWVQVAGRVTGPSWLPSLASDLFSRSYKGGQTLPQQVLILSFSWLAQQQVDGNVPRCRVERNSSSMPGHKTWHSQHLPVRNMRYG